MATTNRSERRPSLAEFAERAVTGWMRGVFQARPGQVKKWEASKQRADIQPLIKLVYQDEEDERQTESDAVITGVPVMFYGGGPTRFVFPISDGTLNIGGSTIAATKGLIIWCDCSLDKWLSGDGKEVDPEYDHRYAHNDAIFIAGLNPFGAALSDVPSDYMSIGFDGGMQIKIKNDVVEVGDKNAVTMQFVALENLVKAEFSKISAQLDLVSTASLTHTHNAPAFGGTTSTPSTGYTNGYSSGEVAAKNLKAEQ